MIERDPRGLSPSTPGAKLDAGKPRAALVLGGFARALKAVVDVGTHGAEKYSPNGWIHVQDGIARYSDAKERHWLDEQAGELRDPKSGLLHAAHEAWNALARLDLMLRETEGSDADRGGDRARGVVGPIHFGELGRSGDGADLG
jgi:hypothetical protein